ncbi:MAG: hypothetical protein ABUL63_00300 [Acidobacteriota bacterium]
MSAWTVRFLSLLLFALPLASWGQEAPSEAPDWTIDNTRWTGPLLPETAIDVRNPYGDVRLRAADGGEVEVSAQIQRRTNDPARAELKIDRRRGRLRIEVAYPMAPRGDLHRVDIAVFVPAGARIAVRTRDGMIQARGLENDVELASTGGNVTLSTSGTARVSAGRGNISAELQRDAWGRPPRLKTREGDITLTLPEDADAKVRVRAGEDIALRRTGRVDLLTPRKAVFTLGKGTHPVSLKSERGRVILLAPLMLSEDD